MRAFTLAFVLPLAPAAAQFDFKFDRFSPGRLGEPLSLAFSGAPANTTLLFLMSTTAGPLPLSLVSPGDTRSLEVGIDLAHVWFATPTGSGTGSITLPVPANPELHGLTLRFQTVTLPGTTFLIDKISNPLAAQFGTPDRATRLAASLTTARSLGSITGHDMNHEVVFGGGGAGSILNPVALDTSEVLDVRRLTVRPGPRLTTARALAATVPLADGRTLVCGGVDANGNVLRSAEVYDPAQRAFVPVGNMLTARCLHAATRLQDGRVLVVGGTTVFTDPVGALANAQSSAEIFNPATGTWSSAAAAYTRLLAPALDTLPDGRVLLSGGFEVQVIIIPLPIGAVSSCRIYNPATGTWSNAPNMRTARALHDTTTLLLPNGDLLVTGGATSGPDLTQATPIAKAEIYRVSSNTWTALPDMLQPVLGHSLFLLGNRAVVAGGAQGTLTAITATAAVQALDLTGLTWSPLPPLNEARGGQGTVVTNDGMAVLLGGQGSSAALATIDAIR
ncbi:MAG TPA: hypothetical protein VK081_10130 [Planctomycetota bacterium]|nr:hypothetical protein [Planctomycetota bacterium]